MTGAAALGAAMIALTLDTVPVRLLYFMSRQASCESFVPCAYCSSGYCEEIGLIIVVVALFILLSLNSGFSFEVSVAIGCFSRGNDDMVGWSF